MLLAQNGRPVVQVVPTQLLEMTVNVMHNRFGGLIRKSIWTCQVRRQGRPDERLHR